VGPTSSSWDALHQPSPLSAFCGTLAGLGGLTGLDCISRVRGWQWGLGGIFGFEDDDLTWFIGAFGALAALLYGAPAAPLGRFWSTIKGFSVTVTVVMALHYSNLISMHFAGFGMPVAVEQVLAPALGIAVMLRLKTLHPPAAACAIQYMQLSNRNQQSPIFLLVPALFGALWMLAIQHLLAWAVRIIGNVSTPTLSRLRTATSVHNQGSPSEVL